MARFISSPNRQVVAVFDDRASSERAIAALLEAGSHDTAIERYEGTADAERFDATGARHGLIARLRRVMQFSLMDQLPAMAWYEAALREGRSVVAVRTAGPPDTLRAVEILTAAGGHFINRFGSLDTEEFARWRGPEPDVHDWMKHERTRRAGRTHRAPAA
ncbi:MAG TPA: hypothetical protein VNL94_05085 [Candidatus Binatia bacterium]|nr:hypothetical protein [Candidatus Binatia bacterium]